MPRNSSRAVSLGNLQSAGCVFKFDITSSNPGASVQHSQFPHQTTLSSTDTSSMPVRFLGIKCLACRCPTHGKTQFRYRAGPPKLFQWWNSRLFRVTQWQLDRQQVAGYFYDLSVDDDDADWRRCKRYRSESCHVKVQGQTAAIKVANAFLALRAWCVCGFRANLQPRREC